jgi:hypothetical protein
MHAVRAVVASLVLVAVCTGGGAAAAQTSADQKVEKIDRDALALAVQAFRQNAGAKRFFQTSYGYAVFPNVGSGAVGIGGAYGEGGVYKKGKLVARTSLTQVTIGLGLGGEAYREIIFFKDKAAFERFAKGGVELGARATATAGDKNVAKEVGYDDGVAIFTLTKAGLIANAAVGGQRFTFDAL